jgi:hypothetical protein
MTINYQQARRIRGTSLSDLFADQLMQQDTGVLGALGKTISLKARARVKGYKEKFDPLRIAKFLTFGSSIGPALYGKLRGRSQDDIKYFTGRSRPIFESKNKAEKIKNVPGGSADLTPINDMLVKIYRYMETSHDSDVKRKELENNKKEENDLEEAKRHKQFMEALAKLTGSKSTATKLPPPKDGSPSLFDSVNDALETLGDKAKKFLDGLFGKGARVAGEQVAKKGAEKIVAKEAGKVAAEQGAKQVAKIAGKEAVEAAVKKTVVKKGLGSVLKKIPLLGAGVGLLFGVNRAIAGDMTGAAIEAASGLSGTLPGAGTVASIGLDITNAARDVYKELYDVYPYSEKDDPTLRQQRLDAIYDELKMLMGPDSSKKENNTVPNQPTTEPPKATTPVSKGRGGYSKASTTSNPNAPSSRFMTASNTNRDLKLPSAPAATTTVNNTSVSKGPKVTPVKKPVPNVRNQEETFRRLIYNSTRVV